MAAVRTTANFWLYQTLRRFYRPYRASLAVLREAGAPISHRAEQQLPPWAERVSRF